MRVYLDHNATTPLRPEALELWERVSTEVGGNPSSLHRSGREARAYVDEARERVANALAVSEEELVFTAGGTEANNIALLGAVTAAGPESRLVTTAAEHSAVLETSRALEARGHPLVVCPVDAEGRPELAALRETLEHESVAVVSVMAANNEVGSVTDLAALAAILADLFSAAPRPLIHTDAVQALGRVPVDLMAWEVDLASFSAHKVGGPKGVGVLWRRSGTPLAPVSYGGGQEHGLRPGTEDVAGIAAAALAIEQAVTEQDEFARRTGELAAFLWREIQSAVPEARLFGPGLDEPRLPNTLCVRIPGTDGKVLVTRLDLEGLEVSAGSACASGSVEPSHVLIAMGHGEDDARSGLRLSLGWNTSHEECKHVALVLKKLFAASRAT